MIPEAQRRALLESSKLKLRAKALLAEGGVDARYEASVLLHEAARAEERTLLASSAPSSETKLASAIERCGCLIDGRDLLAVLERAWPDVLEASEWVPARTARAMRVRIDAKMNAFMAEHRKALAKVPAFRTKGIEQVPLREIDRLLAIFAGDAFLWGAKAHAHFSRSEIDVAWKAIRRGLALSPADALLRQIELEVVPRALPTAEAEARLEATFAALSRGEGDAGLSVGFILAATYLALHGGRRERLLELGYEAAVLGLGLPPVLPQYRKMLRALQLVLKELLARRKPSVEILYRCGLGAWVTGGEGVERDPLAILAQRVNPLDGARAA